MTEMTKTQVSAMVALGLAHEAFTHEEHGTFDITLMRSAAMLGQYEGPLLSLFDERTIFILTKCRDFDEDRILWLIENDRLNEPALCIDAPDSTQILIDGTHRLLGRLAMGMQDFIWYRARWDQAIRPSSSLVENPRNWGKVSIRNGKLYDTKTRKLWRGPKYEGKT